MSRREELLSVIREEKCSEFIEFIKLHNSRNDAFNLDEIIQSLSRRQYDEMWSNLSTTCTDLLTSFDGFDQQETEDDDENVVPVRPEQPQENVDILTGIVTVALCSISAQEPIITPSLVQVAVMLHGIMLCVPENCAKLQCLTAELCEKWFLSDLVGKEELVTCMLPYFIMRSLSQGMVGDVKRLWSLREAFLLIDYEDESSSSLKTLLQQCLIQPLHLKVDEGRRYLSFLFGMHPDFIDELHKTVKNQLPSCPMTSLGFYGEIYFRAWRAAQNVYLEKIELNCIQDLMFHAIHAQTAGRTPMASRLRKVLSYFHQHKKHREVDKMLLKLYEPIIWRACKVANPSVRANAAAILFDVFPFEDPGANVAETDQLLQRQFDVIADFMDDPCAKVRATAVHGVFHISALFWELIPAHVVKELITKIIQTSAYDVSALAVRVAVFKGINYVLENRLCHPLMKTLLPSMRNLIHDNSEKVRIAFLDMLLKVKGMRTIKFWTITPVEHLLGRLEVEQSSPVIRRLVKLLMNSFHPASKENEELLTRCAGLWNTNAEAARKFYQYAHLQISLPAAVKFLLLLCNYALHYSRRQKGNNENGMDDNSTDVDKENDASVQVDETQDDITDVDIDTIAGFLETCAIIWEGIKDQLEQPVQEGLKTKLTQHFSKAIPKLLNSIENTRCQSALTLLAAHLPPDHTEKLSHSFLSVLSSMRDDCPSDVYGPLLECLCSWGKARDVLDVMEERLRNFMHDDIAAKQEKKRKSVNFSLPLTKSMVTLNFIDWLMTSQNCRSHIFNVGDCFKSLTETLSLSMDSLDVYLREQVVSEEKETFLKASFDTYCRLRIHLYEQENMNCEDEESCVSKDEITSSFDRVLSWCQRTLLPHINDGQQNSESEEEPSAGNRAKRGPGSQTDGFITSILKVLLDILSELVMLGITKCRFNVTLAELTSSILQHPNAFTLLPEIGKLLYQITQEISHADGTAIDVKPVEIIFENIVMSAVNCEHPSKLEILVSVRVVLVDVLTLSHRNKVLFSENLNNSLVLSIIQAIIRELVRALQQNVLSTDNYDENSLPVATSFLLEFLFKSNFFIRTVVQEIQRCISGDVLHAAEYQAMSFLLWVLMKNGKLVENVRDCVCQMEKILEKMQAEVNEQQEMPPYLVEAQNIVRDSLQLLDDVTVS